MSRLLLVEDDDTIGRALETGLRAGRHAVEWCRTGEQALTAADSSDPLDVVVLDLGLPDLDGVDVCRALRNRQPASAIIILTARDAEIDVVSVSKPVPTTISRKPIRVDRAARPDPRAPAPRDARPGRRVPTRRRLDRGRRRARAWLGDLELALRAEGVRPAGPAPPTAGAAVSRSTLMADVWDENWFGSTKTLDVHMAALRRTLADAAADDRLRRRRRSSPCAASAID